MNVENDQSGQTLGNWRLVRPLGEGGFGTVYEAEHQGIPGRRGAVKVLHPQMARNADIKRRFINEASAASRAEHENIVQIFDGGVTDSELCYVVMELLTGQSLAQLLSGGPLSIARTVNIGAQVSAALAAAHGLGIVHRDLKPDNIFIVYRDTNPEFVKVLDFGIAKLQDKDGKTQSGVWLGTPAYMAPEQWETLPDIDGRADLYALGVVLYQCLTGSLPYAANTPYEWLSAHMSRPVPELGAVVDGAPELGALVRRLLAKRREERPQMAAEVMRALRRLAGDREITPPPPPPPLPPPPRTLVEPAVPPPPSPRPAWVLPVVLGGLGLGALGLVLALRGGAPAVPAAPDLAVAADLAAPAVDLAAPAADLAAPAADLAAPLLDLAAPVSAPARGGVRKRGADKHPPAAPPLQQTPPPPPVKPEESGRKKYEPIY